MVSIIYNTLIFQLHQKYMVVLASSISNITSEDIASVTMHGKESFSAIIPGNILIIRSIIGYPEMRSATNYFLASLAVADLCVTSVLPAHAVSDHENVLISITQLEPPM